MEAATAHVTGTFHVTVFRCGCGKPRAHAPYIDGERFRNYMRRLRARIFGGPLANVPCPTPSATTETITKVLTPQEIAAITGG